ncbi:unnamed protein product, partial [Brenthis ino]
MACGDNYYARFNIRPGPGVSSALTCNDFKIKPQQLPCSVAQTDEIIGLRANAPERQSLLHSGRRTRRPPRPHLIPLRLLLRAQYGRGSLETVVLLRFVRFAVIGFIRLGNVDQSQFFIFIHLKLNMLRPDESVR